MTTLCPRCQEGVVLTGEPTGSIRADFHGAYFAPAPARPEETIEDKKKEKCAVLLLTDAFGLPLKNCKIIADELASRLGCDVWVPDYFNGEPLLPHEAVRLPDRAGVRLTAWDWIRLFFTVIIFRIPIIMRNRPATVSKRLECFINLVKKERGYEKLGSVGYCFGGNICLSIGKTDFVDSIVIAHPGGFKIDEVNAIKVPVSWACAEDDPTFPPLMREKAEVALAARKGKENFVEYEFKDYKGTTHGFASRPNLELPEIKQAFEGALNQIVEWFTKTLF